MVLERKKIGICVPCYNEEGNVRALYDRVREVFLKIPQYDYEILFMDNHSEDSTFLILKEISKNDKHVKVIRNRKNYGPSKNGAYGLFQVEGDAVISMACDLQDPPELIPEFIEEWEHGSKIVLGRYSSRDEEDRMQFMRKLYYKGMSFFVGDDSPSGVTGFGIYDREVVSLLSLEKLSRTNFRFSILKYGYSIQYIDFIKPERFAGESSYGFWGYTNTAIDSLVMSSQKPVRTIVVAGGVAALVFLIIAIPLFILAIAGASFALLSFAELAVLMSFLGIVVFSIGLIGEYLCSIGDAMMGSPLVYEETRINFDMED